MISNFSNRRRRLFTRPLSCLMSNYVLPEAKKTVTLSRRGRSNWAYKQTIWVRNDRAKTVWFCTTYVILKTEVGSLLCQGKESISLFRYNPQTVPTIISLPVRYLEPRRPSQKEGASINVGGNHTQQSQHTSPRKTFFKNSNISG